MYSGIEFPLRREQANRSPASPDDSRRILPTGARQRTEDHCGPKIVDPASRAHQPPPRRPALFLKLARPRTGELAGLQPMLLPGGSVRGRRHERELQWRGALRIAMQTDWDPQALMDQARPAVPHANHRYGPRAGTSGLDDTELAHLSFVRWPSVSPRRRQRLVLREKPYTLNHAQYGRWRVIGVARIQSSARRSRDRSSLAMRSSERPGARRAGP